MQRRDLYRCVEVDKARDGRVRPVPSIMHVLQRDSAPHRLLHVDLNASARDVAAE